MHIPIGSRIIAVADSVSAMLQDRSYRKAMKFAEVCEEIRKGAGNRYDPRVVGAFLEVRAICLDMGEQEKERHAAAISEDLAACGLGRFTRAIGAD